MVFEEERLNEVYKEEEGAKPLMPAKPTLLVTEPSESCGWLWAALDGSAPRDVEGVEAPPRAIDNEVPWERRALRR